MADEQVKQNRNATYIGISPKELKLERLHLRVFDDDIDILYRPLNTYILFVKNDNDGRAFVKKLALMSRQDFAEVLTTIRAMPKITQDAVTKALSDNGENWFQNAWKSQTDKLLKELGVENPIEEPIWETELDRIKHPDLYEDEETIMDTGKVEIENI